jgi:hypothetical protein
MRRKSKEKEFDAVEMMRNIRDQIDRAIANMDFIEERAYLDKLITEGRRRKEKKTEPAGIVNR